MRVGIGDARPQPDVGRDDGRVVLAPRPRGSRGRRSPRCRCRRPRRARHAASSTDARQVSTESGTSKRACSASIAGTTRSSSSASPTSGPGPALTPPTSSRSAPSATSSSARSQERVEVPGRAAVVEGIGRAVEDAHHERARADVECARHRGADRRERRDGHARQATDAPPARCDAREHRARRSVDAPDRGPGAGDRATTHATSSRGRLLQHGPSGGAMPPTALASKP